MAFGTGAKRWIGVAGLATAAMMVLSACTSGASALDAQYEESSAELPAEVVERIDLAIAEAAAQSASPGAIVGVWAPWAGQYVAGHGTTDPGGATPMSPDMHFRIGDTTSSMTCTVLLRLVDEGTVKLSDPVQQYVEHIPNVGDVTLGQLCQGTSGFGDYRTTLSPSFTNNPTRVWPPLEIVSSGLAAAGAGAPGSAWSGSDTGVNLLGIALMRITNKSWADLYQQYIFGPVGMEQSSFPDGQNMTLPSPAASGFHTLPLAEGGLNCEAPRDQTTLSNSMSWVAGGAVSTAADLHHWGQALASGALLGKKSAKAQTSVVPLGGEAPSWQGYGLGVMKDGPLLGHSGQIPGFISAMLTDPASGLTVVVMLNNSTVGEGFAMHVAERIASIASKLPPVEGAKAPTIELPWSEEQMAEVLAAAAICQPAPAA